MQRPRWGLAQGGRNAVTVASLAVVGVAVAGSVGYTAVFAGAKTASPPTVALAFPATQSSYNSAGWSAGCATSGFCGTAADSTGVAHVQASIQQVSSGRYWNGSAFAASSATFVTASLAAPGATTTAWSYAFPVAAFPADGAYAVRVRAVDNGGRQTQPAQYATAQFTVDRIAPPTPVLTQTPDDPTFSTSASFSFTDGDATATFECSIDGGAYAACTTGAGYGNLALGDHTFDVRAVDPASNRSGAAAYAWTIVTRSTFPVSGTLGALLYPGGAAVPIDLTISNPFNFTLKVTAVSVAITGTSSPACSASANFTVVHDLATSVLIGAGQTQSLSQLGVAPSLWPTVAMRDTGLNQDACRSATVSFSFTGSGTKATQ